MNAELQQNALNVVGQKASVVIASGAVTAGAGVSTYLEILPAITGFIGMSVGAFVSLGLFCLSIKMNRLKRKQIHLTIAVLEEKEAERLDRAAFRKVRGKPVRRADDQS